MVFQIKQWVMAFSFFAAVSCGESTVPEEVGKRLIPFKKYEPHFLSPTESAAKDSSKDYKVPARFLFAVGYVESKLQPDQLSFFEGGDSFDFPQSASAFAISRADLDIEDNSTQDRLSTQLRAYAKWLSINVLGKELSENPSSSQEKFDWIWEIASLHRYGQSHKYTERSVFTREMIKTLNEGFHWFDPESKENRYFAPEDQKIELETLNDKSRGLLNIRTRQSQVDFAKKVFLSALPLSKPEAFPRGIEISHCPFSLSVCLDMQNNYELMDAESGWTHYMIPSDDLISDMSLQVRNHHLVFDPKVEVGGSQHKIRIMLTGNSGRLVNGSRKMAFGDWLTHWQMERLAELTEEICSQMVNDPENLDFDSTEACLTPNVGIFFRTSKKGEKEDLFSIPDFDKEIFYHYLGDKNRYSKADFLVENKQEVHKAGETIKFLYSFSENVKYIEREELIRCFDGDKEKLVWSNSELVGVLGLKEKKEEQMFWSWGPNHDGSHFFRAKFYDEDGEIVAWDFDTIRLYDFEEKDNPILRKKCQSLRD